MLRQPSNRLGHVDAVRGACILSMLTLHIAEPAVLTRATHEMLVLDGAHGFVLLAGLVLGIVERRRARRGDSLSVTRRAALRRIGLLAIAHWAVVILVVLGNAVLAKRALFDGDPGFTSRSVIDQLGQVVALRVMPESIDILPMYVLFFVLFAAVYAPLLRRDHSVWVAIVSAALWVVSQLGDGFTSWLLAPFAALAWQALFAAGLITGWHFERAKALRRATSPWSMVVAIVAVVICAGLARESVNRRLGISTQAVSGWVSKFQLGPLNLLGGLGLVMIATVSFGALQDRNLLQRPRQWLELLGRRSLASYLTISVLAWVSHLLPSKWRAAGRGDALIVVGALITTLIAELRDRWSRRDQRGAVASNAAMSARA